MTRDAPPRNGQPAEHPPEPTPVEPVEDERTGEELGEVSGGGEITDLGGDAPSS